MSDRGPLITPRGDSTPSLLPHRNHSPFLLQWDHSLTRELLFQHAAHLIWIGATTSAADRLADQAPNGGGLAALEISHCRWEGSHCVGRCLADCVLFIKRQQIQPRGGG